MLTDERPEVVESSHLAASGMNGSYPNPTPENLPVGSPSSQRS